jgi:hypothetical protein
MGNGWRWHSSVWLFRRAMILDYAEVAIGPASARPRIRLARYSFRQARHGSCVTSIHAYLIGITAEIGRLARHSEAQT